MNSTLKVFSACCFGLNYGAAFFCALHLQSINNHESQRKLFYPTLYFHAGFLGINYAINFLKFSLPHYRVLMALNDGAAFFFCFPSYAILSVPRVLKLIGYQESGDQAIDRKHLEEVPVDQLLKELGE